MPLSILRDVFGYAAFRGPQEAIIDHVTGGGDALVLMPTGGGKSLCFQVPALCRDGLTLVISPLVALMKDQVDALRACAAVGDAELLWHGDADLKDVDVVVIPGTKATVADTIEDALQQGVALSPSDLIAALTQAAKLGARTRSSGDCMIA